MNCLNCNKEIDSEFCNKKCKASYKTRCWRAHNKKICEMCNINWILPESENCKDCAHIKRGALSIKVITINDAKSQSKRWYSAYIRQRIKSSIIKPYKSCFNCGYDKHIEVCHIKAVSSFPDETLISDVNRLENLTILCPNCHWEFDNIGGITVPTIADKIKDKT